MYIRGNEVLLRKKKSKGFAIIYVIIIMVPVLLASSSMLDLVSTDFFAENIVEKGTQARYNAEAGIEYGIKMLQAGRYTTDYNYDTAYLFFDDAENKDSSRSYAGITIKQGLIGKRYIISSEGFYMGVKNVIEKSIEKDFLLNMSRKFTAVKISAPSRVNFQIAMNNSAINLLEKSRFLILGEGLKTPADIKLFANNSNDIQWQSSLEGLFTNSSIMRDQLWNISTQNILRGMWKPSGTNIIYYVSEKGKNITLDLNSIGSSNEELFRGFRDYIGVITETGISSNQVRLMLIDGDMTIKGIRGEFKNKNITMAQRYLNNIVIYCKGKLTIDDCILAAYDVEKNLVDLNISFIAEEIEFKLSNGSISSSSEISYRSGNNDLLVINEEAVVDLIRQNTSIYSDWWI